MDPIEEVPSDTGTVIARLRQLIVAGHWSAGMRLAEIPVAQSLGLSRTPVRLALRTLEQEGLVEKAGTRGYVVRAVSEADIRSAIEVRGALEGLAARRLAERGLPPAVRQVLADCVAEGRAVLAPGSLSEDAVGRWARLNHRFHRAIVSADDSRVIADAIARNDHLPFASAGSIVIDTAALDAEYRKLSHAQLQHELVLEALTLGESARVEMLMREHAWIGLRYGRIFGAVARAQDASAPADGAIAGSSAPAARGRGRAQAAAAGAAVPRSRA
jgi:GntR family transcriptional regulator of vanillate catabolism